MYCRCPPLRSLRQGGIKAESVQLSAVSIPPGSESLSYETAGYR